MLLDVPQNPSALGAMTIPLGVGTAVDGPGFRRLPALRAHAMHPHRMQVQRNPGPHQGEQGQHNAAIARR